MAKRELTCFVRSLTGAHPDIELRDGEAVVLGRSPLTGVKEGRCSRQQLQLTADYSSRIQEVKKHLNPVPEVTTKLEGQK